MAAPCGDERCVRSRAGSRGPGPQRRCALRSHAREAEYPPVRAASARRRPAAGGRFFEDLLMPALHRAVALEQMDAAAVRIREHLELDVPRLGQIFFQEHAIVAEARLRLAPCRAERSVERIVTLDDA